MKENFKVGDIVIGKNMQGDYSVLNGVKGKVIYISTQNNIGIQWDIYIYDGHSCNNRGTQGKCRYYSLKNNNEERDIKLSQHVSQLKFFEKDTQLEFLF